jgi:Icc protein
MLRTEEPEVLLAQITDTHITRNGPQARYLGEIIAQINALRPLPDAVLLSGDAADDGRREQYAALRDLLARCESAVYVVPGNHDARAALRDVLPAAYFPGAAATRVDFSVDVGAIRAIGLDTAEQRRPGGILPPVTLDWLDATLAADPARPTLIFMHHPPFRTGVNAADMFGFSGLSRFRAIVARYPAVRRIIAGHIHCERFAAVGGALASTSLSSIPQRVPELFERRRVLHFRPEPAGFATHEWRDGAFVSITYVNVGGGRFVERVAG